MATVVTMPSMGYDMKEGIVVRWRKKEGEQVARGEVIAEIETDKATVEMEAYVSGVLGKIVAEEGDAIPVGDLIAVITAPDEEVPPSGELGYRSSRRSCVGGGYGAPARRSRLRLLCRPLPPSRLGEWRPRQSHGVWQWNWE